MLSGPTSPSPATTGTLERRGPSVGDVHLVSVILDQLRFFLGGVFFSLSYQGQIHRLVLWGFCSLEAGTTRSSSRET